MSRGTIDPERLAGDYENAERALAKTTDKLSRIAAAAQRFGVSKKEVEKVMQSAGIRGSVLPEIMSGKTSPLHLSKKQTAFLKDSYPERLKEITEAYDD